MQIVIFVAIFFLIALASKRIGTWFSALGLPYITGYLLAGMLAGPFILDILPEGSTTDLRFIDEISLGIIAFVAGSELYLREIRSRIRSIGSIVGMVMLVALPLGGIGLYVLTSFIPFTNEMPVMDRVAVAVLGTTILLALSPPSTIAVIKEVRAKGMFTRTLLGVTVTMDVVIVILFAIAVAIASALLTGEGLSLLFLITLILDLALAVVAGWIVGNLLQAVLATPFHKYLKIAAILGLGYAIFVVAHLLRDVTSGFVIELHIEPLLVALIGGFYVTNFTTFRNQFEDLLHEVGPPVYVAFFTLTGVGIKLDILLQTWPIALALFSLRFININIGAFAGSKLAGESSAFARNAGLALITQAGIALGLAREVAVSFPRLGDAFATMVISVVVLNEVFGPMFLKAALRRAGETNLPEDQEADMERDVLILGIEEQSLELARQLQRANWRVVMADTDQSHVDRLKAADVVEHYIQQVDEESLSGLIGRHTDAVVAMLESDDDNLVAAGLAFKRGVPRLIVRPSELRNSAQFTELGALVVDPTSAMVNLLTQSVRAPQSTAVLLHQDSNRELVQITLANSDIDGILVRDLRLPGDVLVLDVNRDGNSIVPNGYTRLRMGDEITLIGRPEALEDATFKLGY